MFGDYYIGALGCQIIRSRARIRSHVGNIDGLIIVLYVSSRR